MDIQFFNAATLLPSEDNLGVADSFVTTMDKRIGFQYNNVSGFYDAVSRILNLGEHNLLIHANRRRYKWNKWNSTPSEDVLKGLEMSMFPINLKKRTQEILEPLGGKTLLTFSTDNIDIWKMYEKVVIVNMTTPENIIRRRVKFSGVVPSIIQLSEITSVDDFKQRVLNVLDGETPDVALFYLTLSKFNLSDQVSANLIQELLKFSKISVVVEYDINKLQMLGDYKFPVFKRGYLNKLTSLNGLISTWSTNRYAILDLKDERHINDYTKFLERSVKHVFKEDFMTLPERVLAKFTLINVLFNAEIEVVSEDEEEE